MGENLVRENLKKLVEERGRLWEATGKPLADVAMKRALSVDETKVFHRAEQEFRSYDSRVKALETSLEQEDVVAHLQNELRGAGAADGSFLPPREELRGWGHGDVELPPDLANAWFDRVRASSVVLGSGIQVLSVEGGAVQLPTLTRSVMVGQRDEFDEIAESEPGMKMPLIRPVSFAALTKVSNELLQDWKAASQVIEADLLRTFAAAVDVALLQGPGDLGTKHRVRGLATQPGHTVIDSTGGAGVELDDLAAAIAQLEATNADRGNLRLFVAPDVWASLRASKDSAGRYLMTPDVSLNAAAALWGVQVGVSAHLSPGTAIGVDVSAVVIGEGQAPTLMVNEAAGFAQNATWFRITGRYDLAAIRADGIVVVKGNERVQAVSTFASEPTPAEDVDATGPGPEKSKPAEASGPRVSKG